MKKYLMMAVAVLAVLAVAMPSFALEMKYGGLFRVRLQSNDNVTDGNDDLNDNENFVDQRLRMYFTFISSENLQVVTKWEADTRWGADSQGSTNFSQPPNGRQGGGDVGADAVNLEMKNVYIDFAIPMTPVRMTAGVQTLTLLSGWVVDDDFSALTATAKLDPVRITMGYIAAKNENIINYGENIDDFFVNVSYADGPFKAGLVGIYQYGHNTDVSADPGIIGNATNVQSNVTRTAKTGIIEDNNVFDLGLTFEYKVPLWSAYINFVKNFGSFDNVALPVDTDTNFDGWMVDAGGSLYCGPFTFNLGGFVTSGSEINDGQSGQALTDYSRDFNSMFRYPAGVSHYWSEIMGLGSLDEAVNNVVTNPAPGDVGGGLVGNNDRNKANRGYASADHPSNLWMVNAGAAWQALEGTKLTLNYYYIGTTQDVLADIDEWNIRGGNSGRGNSVGHEFDAYVDQKIVDKLNLRIVGAYLFADEAYTMFPDDSDAYEVGAVLMWAF